MGGKDDPRWERSKVGRDNYGNVKTFGILDYIDMGKRIADHISKGIWDPVEDMKNFLYDSAKTVGTAAKSMLNWFAANHPEWYAPSYTYPVPIGANFAIDKAKPIQLSSDERGVIRNGYTQGLIMTNMVALTTFSPYDESNTWSMSLERMRQILMANNGRVSTYSDAKLGAFMCNVRTMYAILAEATRAFEIGYTFSVEDTTLPDSMLYAANLDVESWTAEPGIIREALRMMWFKLTTNFPIKFDMIDRAIWLFGNLFADGFTGKPSYCVNKLSNTYWMDQEGIISEGQYIGEIGRVSNPGTHRYTFDDYRNAFEELYRLTDNMVKGSQLRADMLRVFGVGTSSQYMEWAMAKLSATIPAVSVINDPFYLAQLKNATTACYSYSFTDDGEIYSTQVSGYTLTQSAIFTLDNGTIFDPDDTDLYKGAIPGCVSPMAIVAENRANFGWERFSPTYFDALPEVLREDKGLYIDSPTPTLDALSTASLTRFAIPYRNVLLIRDSADEDEDDYIVCRVAMTHGTEAIMAIRFTFASIIEGDAAISPVYKSLPYTSHYFVLADSMPAIDVINTYGLASTFDFVPKSSYAFNDGYNAISPIVPYWDFDHYALVPESTLKSLNALALAGLLDVTKWAVRPAPFLETTNTFTTSAVPIKYNSRQANGATSGKSKGAKPRKKGKKK